MKKWIYLIIVIVVTLLMGEGCETQIDPRRQAMDACIKNDGVPILNNLDTMIDCKKI